METPKLRILIVDDDECSRTVLCEILHRAGYEADGARNGIEALMYLRHHPYEAIVSDLNMPRMSGLELLSFVRVRWPTVPVVIVSADLTTRRSVQAQQGAFAVLAKPYEHRSLLTILDSAVQKAHGDSDPSA